MDKIPDKVLLREQTLIRFLANIQYELRVKKIQEDKLKKLEKFILEWLN